MAAEQQRPRHHQGVPGVVAGAATGEVLAAHVGGHEAVHQGCPQRRQVGAVPVQQPRLQRRQGGAGGEPVLPVAAGGGVRRGAVHGHGPGQGRLRGVRQQVPGELSAAALGYRDAAPEQGAQAQAPGHRFRQVHLRPGGPLRAPAELRRALLHQPAQGRPAMHRHRQAATRLLALPLQAVGRPGRPDGRRAEDDHGICLERHRHRAGVFQGQRKAEVPVAHGAHHLPAPQAGVAGDVERGAASVAARIAHRRRAQVHRVAAEVAGAVAVLHPPVGQAEQGCRRMHQVGAVVPGKEMLQAGAGRRGGVHAVEPGEAAAAHDSQGRIGPEGALQRAHPLPRPSCSASRLPVSCRVGAGRRLHPGSPPAKRSAPPAARSIAQGRNGSGTHL